MSGPIVLGRGIPMAALTPLEQFLLEELFESWRDPEDGELWLWASEGEADSVEAPFSDLERLLAASMGTPSGANAYVLSHLQGIRREWEKRGLAELVQEGDDLVELDFSEVSWEFILQDVIHRTPGLDFVQYTRAWTGKMSPGQWGARACLVTESEVLHKSTDELDRELLAEARARGLVPPEDSPGAEG